MFKNFRDKIALSGITVLMIGVALLIFTFISAYGFLTQSLSIIASEDLVQTFGQALAPLIVTCIHIMYLGVMGWVGSLVTIRGVTIIAHTPQTPLAITTPAPVATQNNVQNQQRPTSEKAKPKKPQEEIKETPKASEPEFVVIPPEQITQPPQQTPQNQQQKDNSTPQSSNS